MDETILNSKSQYDIVEEVDCSRPVSIDSSVREGLSRPDMLGFAASITENDSAYFNRLQCTDFQAISNGHLDPIDERLLKFGDEIKSCVAADASFVDSVVELITHLIFVRNFASATAALAALRSANIRPRKLFKFWYLIDSRGNYYSYRVDYSRGAALPCPTPHVRELEQTQHPQEVMAAISKYKFYRASGVEKPPKTGAECYRRSRMSKHLKSTHSKVSLHEQRAPAEEERCTKRARVDSIDSKEMELSNSQTIGVTMPVPSTSGSFPSHLGSQITDNERIKRSKPPTPSKTLPHRTSITLPHINELDAYIFPSRANESSRKLGKQLLPLHFGASGSLTREDPRSAADEINSYNPPSIATVAENSIRYGSRYLPLPKFERVTGFTPVNQVVSAASIIQGATQCFNPVERIYQESLASTRTLEHSAQSHSDSVSGESQLHSLEDESPKDMKTQLNPSYRQVRPSWMLQQSLHPVRTNFNDVKSALEPCVGMLGMPKVAATSSSTIQDKGKGRLAQPPPKALMVQSPMASNESLEESIRSTAKFNVRLLNIHNAT